MLGRRNVNVQSVGHRGRPHITSSRRGGGGVLGLMTIDDEGEGGVH